MTDPSYRSTKARFDYFNGFTSEKKDDQSQRAFFKAAFVGIGSLATGGYFLKQYTDRIKQSQSSFYRAFNPSVMKYFVSLIGVGSVAWFFSHPTKQKIDLSYDDFDPGGYHLQSCNQGPFALLDKGFDSDP